MNSEGSLRPVLIYQPLGNIWVALEWFAAKLGIITITALSRQLLRDTTLLKPAPITDRIKLLGAANSPEMICFPYKAILGSLIDQLSKFWDMVGGREHSFYPLILGHESTGPCRERCYYKAMEIRLKELFPEKYFEMYIAKESLEGLFDMVLWFAEISRKNRLAVALLINEAIERLKFVEEFEERIRFGQSVSGDFNRLERILDIVKESAASVDVSLQELKRILAKHSRVLPKVVINQKTIVFLGEIFHIEEAGSSSCDVIRETARQGYFPKKEVGLGHYLHRYELSISRFLHFLFSQMIYPLSIGRKDRIRKLAYRGGLRRDPGGHALDKIAVLEEFSTAKKRNASTSAGVIELAPAFCLPQVVAENVSIPILRRGKVSYVRLIFDEQTGRGGVGTRLEAFFDMILSRSVKRKCAK